MSAKKQRIEKLKSVFEEYDQFELIAILGGLQIYPENHSHTIRLEVASRLACISKSDGKRRVNLKALKRTLDESLSAKGPIGMLEDPLEVPFTENIMFFGGNYIIYPGLVANVTFILQMLLRSIFKTTNDLDEKFKIILYVPSVALLTLSNEMAKRARHDRYMESSDRFGDNIEIPEKAQVNVLRDSVVFTKEEVDILLKDLGIDWTSLFPFITKIGDTELYEEEIEGNPLLVRPLVEMNDKLIITLPGSLASALRNYIWVSANQHGFREMLLKIFSDVTWRYLFDRFVLMGFQPSTMSLPRSDDDLPLTEGLFQIDTDKAAYILLITDDVKDQEMHEVIGVSNLGGRASSLENRYMKVLEWLTGRSPQYFHEVLFIIVVAKIGPGMTFGLGNKIPKTRILVITPTDLDSVLVKSCDSLTLWKYAGTNQRFLGSGQIILFSFLDGYAFYLDHNHSYYFGGDRTPDLFVIRPGTARELRLKTARVLDVHAAEYYEGAGYRPVRRRVLNESTPIYVKEELQGDLWEHLVEGYAQPIWISPEIDRSQINPNRLQILSDVTETLSYWLWQLAPELRGHLEALGSAPIRITYQLEDMDSWIPPCTAPFSQGVSALNFKSSIHGREIHMTIPKAIRKYLMSENNQGERLLLKALLKMFAEIKIELNNLSEFNEREIERIVDKVAPLGRKKKLIMIDTQANIVLETRNLPPVRFIQEHDIEEQLSDLAKDLGVEIPQVTRVVKTKDRNKLCKSIVELYIQRIRSKLANFNYQFIIEGLIGNNEAIWWQKEFKKLTTPTKLACFGDDERFLEKDKEDFLKIERSALCTRILIEIVAAEPPMGRQEVSISELDALLAMTYNMVNWAFLSDQIHLNIFDHKLKILPSGRIAVKKETYQEYSESFVGSKAIERVDVAKDRFDTFFRKEGAIDHLDEEVQEIEKVYKAEFGFTLSEMVNFYELLIYLGFQQDSVAARMHLSELKKKIKENLGWSDLKVGEILDLLTLFPREKWEVPPNGFDAKDLWPWRYNRRLSYLRRPLIMTPRPEKDPLILWGPRHAFMASQQLYNLIISGRYKTTEDSSEEMKKYIGKILDEAGDYFVDLVKAWLKNNSNWLVKAKVPINPRKPLKSSEDLGDVDILMCDVEKGRIFSIECKNINYGRNPRETANELERLFEGSSGGASWIQKHLRRDRWLKKNMTALSSIFKQNFQKFKIYSFVLTSEEIPSPYIRKMPLPFIAFTELRREGIKLIERITTN